MNPLLSILVFLASVAIAAAAAFVLPPALGWPPATTMLAAAFLPAATVFGLALYYAHRLHARLHGLETTIARHMSRLDEVDHELEACRTDIEESGRRRDDILRELKVLQTLLGQFYGRGGAPSTDKKAARTGVSDGRRRVRKSSSVDIQAAIRNALSENRVDLYLQPTVSLPSRRPTHYECFSRVRDEHGTVMYPGDYLPEAESSGLVGTLDNLLLFRCIQLIRKLGPRRRGLRFFYNIAAGSITDDDFFPQFVDYMLANHELADRLVFEFAQRDFMDFTDAARLQLGVLGEGGYRFSLDNVEDLEFDAATLAGGYVGYLKVDVSRLLERGRAHGPGEFRRRLDRDGLKVIAARVEKEDQVLELLDHDYTLAQGYLFGEPRPSREVSASANGAETS